MALIGSKCRDSSVRPNLRSNRGSAASGATANAVDAAHSVPSAHSAPTPSQKSGAVPRHPARSQYSDHSLLVIIITSSGSLDGRDVMRILHSFRQFVVHHDKSRTLKNPRISVWAQIGNMLQLDSVQHHEEIGHFAKTPDLGRLQDVLHLSVPPHLRCSKGAQCPSR